MRISLILWFFYHYDIFSTGYIKTITNLMLNFLDLMRCQNYLSGVTVVVRDSVDLKNKLMRVIAYF
jgi:hypothetical protein